MSQIASHAIRKDNSNERGEPPAAVVPPILKNLSLISPGSSPRVWRWRRRRLALGRMARRSGEVYGPGRHKVDLEVPQIHRGSRGRRRRTGLEGWRRRGRGGLGQVQPASSHQLHHLLISRRGSSSPLCSSVPLSQDWSLLHNARRECSTRALVETETGAVCTSPVVLVLQSQPSPPRCKAALMELVSRRRGAETEEAAGPPPPFPGPAGTQG